MKTRNAEKLGHLITGKRSDSGLPPKLRAAATNDAIPHPQQFAHAAGLTYVSHIAPGIQRIGSSPQDFRYRGPNGRMIHDPATLRRIRALVIPPAWKNVWICRTVSGHLQATGIDARGRKQYRYHARWRATRDETKFNRMIAFGKALPKIRRTTAAHIRLKGLPREKVLAVIVQLLEKTLIRVGNAEYARSNHSFGLTTIRNQHVSIRGKRLRFEFRGKSGMDHDIHLENPVLARIVKLCQDLPGQELFEYIDEVGRDVDVNSHDVNVYLKEITGQEFTAKDFRTWSGTVLAAKALREISAFDSQAQARKNILGAIEQVAKRLGNTRSVCRKCYIHPALFDAYMDGSLMDILQQRARREMKNLAAFSAEEAAVLAFLQERLRREAIA